MHKSEEWIPKTELGKKVASGEVSSLDEIFKSGLKIKEPQIVDRLLPNLQTDIIFFGGSPGKGGGIKRTPTRRTARMHRSGRRFSIAALVAVGAPGYIGLGKSSSKEHAIAIEKATAAAKLNIIPIKRACGSWECMCGTAHSIPIAVTGKSGSVRIELKPAPKGLGLAIGDEAKKMLIIAGVRDIWSKARGKTQSRLNYATAVFNAFKTINRLRGDLKEGKVLKEEELPPPQKKPVEEISEELKEVAAVLEEEVVATSAAPEMKINQEAEGIEEK